MSRLRTASLSSNPSEFDLCEVLEDVFQTARLFGDSDVKGEFRPKRDECPVFMDEKLFRHVVTNLISNAFKYADGGAVTVILDSIGDSAVEISVEDTGIGMSEEDLSQLFTPFHRGRNVASIAGTGLGMSIAKDATTLMGGKLELESELGVGTKATITLPFHAPGEDDWEVESEWVFPATQTGSVPERER